MTLATSRERSPVIIDFAGIRGACRPTDNAHLHKDSRPAEQVAALFAHVLPIPARFSEPVTAKYYFSGCA